MGYGGATAVYRVSLLAVLPDAEMNSTVPPFFSTHRYLFVYGRGGEVPLGRNAAPCSGRHSSPIHRLDRLSVFVRLWIEIIENGVLMPNYVAELSRLYRLQADISDDPYLHIHSRNSAVVRRQVSIFERCESALKDAHTILDWGCRHGADACMVRMLLGTGVKIYGCDVDPLEYRAFYDFSDLKYSQLTHPYRLPYEDNFFDAVIGSGVLEHVPIDSESLKELYRIIRPEGHFIMTMLPNKYSYTEWLNRRLGNPHHMRLYSLREALHMFMHHGFLPMVPGYHQMLPSLSGPRSRVFDLPLANKFVESLFWLNPFLERLWPLNKLSTNIFIVGKKVNGFN